MLKNWLIYISQGYEGSSSFSSLLFILIFFISQDCRDSEIQLCSDFFPITNIFLQTYVKKAYKTNNGPYLGNAKYIFKCSQKILQN